MKKKQIIGLTQRVDIIKHYDERRDAIDQQWYSFFKAADIIPILLPNSLSLLKQMLEIIDFSGFVLSGGNNLIEYEGDAPERDEVEHFLIDSSLPIIGVCRGMHSIQHHFQVPLYKVENHVQKNQVISINSIKHHVNSYHTIGTHQSNHELQVLAHSEDGIVKAVKHINRPILGIMWHPERLSPFHQRDLVLFNQFFTNQEIIL